MRAKMRSRSNAPAHRARQGGSMLIEALMAILVFSIGVLSLVGMQAAAIGHVNDAKYRADASFLANQVIGEMWVNRANLASYAYSGGTVPPVLANWVAQVQGTLPGAGTTPPKIVIGNNSVVTVTVSWKLPSASATHNHTVVANLNN